MEIADQPVLAWKTIRYQGEAVAIVAADDPETARRAVKAIKVEYERAAAADRRRGGDEAGRAAAAPVRQHRCATCASTTATRTRPRRSSSPATTRSACRTRPSSAPSPASRSPTRRAASTSTSPPSGCTSTATRSPRASASRTSKVRLSMGGVGGAFGGREDLSMQVHACMLALHTGRPVKIVYNRTESFYGHVHRHPAKMYYEHGADHDGNLLYVRAKVVLDGGAYASSSPAVASQRRQLRRRPVRGAERAPGRVRDVHEQPAVRRDARLRRGPGRVRPRGADGQARRRAGHGPGRAADQERDGAGHR